MNDLISRKAAITLPVMPKEHREYQTQNLDDAYEQGWFDLQTCIEKLPSAQLQIIRCRDCKWYEIYQLKKDATDDRRYKPSYCVNLAFHASPDWFCADGERRDE